VSTSPNRTPHDRLLKELLRRFLPEFLQLFFPDEAARLNFTTLRFVDKELIVNIPDHVVRITDTVAEVETLAGEPEVILVHVELEAGHLHSLPQRMHDYYSLLRIIEQKQVLPLALVLLPGAGGLTWRVYEETLFDRELLRFCYGQVGIRDLSSESYLGQGDPVAAALAALMQPGDMGKAVVKLNAFTSVVDSQLTDGDKLFLIEIVETYLPWEEVTMNARQDVLQRLNEFEETWVTQALRQGREEGREEGKRELLLHLLRAKFPGLPADIEARIRSIADEDQLEQLSIQVLSAEKLADLELPATDQPNGEA